MDKLNSPFHRFQGWRLLALLAVGIAYSYWFAAHGPYSKLAALAPGMPLEAAMHYSGEHAVQVLSSLDGEGRKAKYISLLFDVPYMILTALMLEGLIAFGIRHMKLTGPKWRLLFILPIAFLLVDFAENSFLALTLASGSQITGTIAGLLTPLKMMIVLPTEVIALVMGLGGLIAWLMGKRRSA